MKRFFTLGALGLLSASAAFAQGPTLDGRILASEIGTGVGKYQSLGQFTNPRGFGHWGIKEAFVAEDANYLYVAINGTVEPNGNSFQIFFDVPGFTGKPRCEALPPAPSASGDATSFMSMTAALEMETDAGVAFRYNGGVPQLELADYRQPTPVSQVLGTMTDDGAVAIFLGGAAKAAYVKADSVSLLGGTANTNQGLEFAVLKAAYQIANGNRVNLFVLMNNGDGGYLSTDFVPQSVTPSGNLGTGPDFCLDVDGTQFRTYVIGQGLLGLKKADAATFSFTVSPNPVAGQDASVNFSLAKAAAGSVIVTDLLGRQVAVLANGTLPAGDQRLTLKAASLAAGQYIVKLQLGDKVATRKLAVQ
ncbi:MAG: T9SS type A sorting domain-containing protein [Hymenobacteraceae bacterium]|nr:T9SS type A sorting domain-containing protein [Hymenobacteraceae bacterium]